MVPEKWINWEWMANKDDPVFRQIRAECDRRQLTDLMGLYQDWSNEMVAQFYATLWIESDNEDIQASRLHWTLEGQRFDVTYADFAQILGFGEEDRQRVQIDVYDPQPDTD